MNLDWNVNKQSSFQRELKNATTAIMRIRLSRDNQFQVYTVGLVGKAFKNVVLDGAYISVFSALVAVMGSTATIFQTKLFEHQDLKEKNYPAMDSESLWYFQL